MENINIQDLLGQDYIIKERIGAGGMGTVLKIYAPKEKMYYAAKIIEERDAMDGHNEAEIMRNLHHFMLPQLRDIFYYDICTIIIMEYIEGQNMQQYIEERGPVNHKQAVMFLRQLAEVLMYLHGMNPPVIYRDLKPSNIMVEKDGTLRLIDFGTARSFKRNNSNDTIALGTPGYAAPEQLMGAFQSDVRTDIYALGATMYYIVTGVDIGKPPFEILPIHSLRTGIASSLEHIIIRCLQKNPESRFQNMMDLIMELDCEEQVGKNVKTDKFNPINIYISHSSKNILK